MRLNKYPAPDFDLQIADYDPIDLLVTKMTSLYFVESITVLKRWCYSMLNEYKDFVSGISLFHATDLHKMRDFWNKESTLLIGIFIF